MKILLLTLQVGLALHTGIGAVWKLMNPTALLPMFPMIPAVGFTILSLLELVAVGLLLLPFVIKPLRGYGWIGGALVAVEMLGFTALYLSTGTANYGPIYYWLVVAAVSVFIAYKRFAEKPAV